MDSIDKKSGTERFYPNYRATSFNTPAEPHSNNSFLRHSQAKTNRLSWNEELERSPIQIETPLQIMKKIDSYQKNQKGQQGSGSTGRKGKFQFLRHTIDYHGKGYAPEQYGGTGKNKNHYQSSTGIRNYAEGQEDNSRIENKYSSKVNLNDYQPKQIDFLARHKHYNDKKTKTYTDMGNNGEPKEEEVSYDLARTGKSPRPRIRTEGQEYGYQNPNLSYSVNRGSYTQTNNYHGKSYQDEVKIARTNTYAFETKYDMSKFNKKPTYHYYTPKSDNQNEANDNQIQGGSKKSPGIQSPVKPSSVSTTNKPSLYESNQYNKYQTISPAKQFSTSRLKQEKQKSGSLLNLVQVNISASKRESVKQRKPVCLSDFQLGKSLGQGKFGNVYMAMHKETHCIFALKKVKKDQIRQHKLENQFMMEIKMQLHFNHQNILGLYGFFDDETYVYLILEYMEEGTLFNQMKKEKKLNEQNASRRMNQVLQAIFYLHQKNIAHRDIKPENIVISNGVCKLCDFGWAAICDERRKTLCGTIDYVSPQVLKGEGYGTQIDLWCLGVLCYELLVGKAPFYHIKIKETMKKIMNIPNELSQDAKDFISKMIVSDPERRMSANDALQHPFITNHKEIDLISSPTRR